MNYIRNLSGVLLSGIIYLAGSGCETCAPRCDVPARPVIEQRIIQRPVTNIHYNAGRDIVVRRTGEDFSAGRGVGESCEREVYNGELNGFDVVYRENVFDKESGKLANVLQVDVDGKRYLLYDSEEAHRIGEGSWESDRIEKIVEMKFNNRNYVSEVNSSTRRGRKIANFFNEANKYYKDARKAIMAGQSGVRGPTSAGITDARREESERTERTRALREEGEIEFLENMRHFNEVDDPTPDSSSAHGRRL